MTIRRLLSLILVLLPLAPAAGRADSFTPVQRAEIIAILRDALRTDPSILRDAVQALQQDEATQQAKSTRGAIAAAQPALVHTATDPVAGNPSGDVTVIEFFDVRCPYCRRMTPTLAELLRRDPNVRLVYKDIPVLGPASLLGARAEVAAQLQGGFQRMHDLLMAGSPDITQDRLRGDAARAGLDWDRMQRDMSDPQVQTRLDANLELAQKLSIQGTPAYVIGARMISGAVDLAELQAAVTDARRNPIR